MIQRTKKYRLGRRSHPPSFQVAKPGACCFKRNTTVVPRLANVKSHFDDASHFMALHLQSPQRFTSGLHNNPSKIVAVLLLHHDA